jgi:hypothetical protein
MNRLSRWLFGSRKAASPVRIRKPWPTRTPLRLERLEDRTVPAAPTLDPLPNVTIPLGQTLQMPLTGTDADGDAIVYSITGDTTPGVASGTFAPDGNSGTPNTYIKITVSGVDGGNVAFSGDMTFMLFDDLTPDTVDRIVELISTGNFAGYFNGAFHRIVDGFVAQGGDP